MKILLTGKDGQVGFELQQALAPLGEVVALGRADFDLSDEAAMTRVLRELAPGVIVNPAAYTAVDKAETERERAFAVNGTAPGVLGRYAQAAGALVVHYSTDYVFDGTKAGSYIETDTPNPQNVYGASKLAGEQALQASGAAQLIFRTSWVVGAHGGNFAKTMLRLAAEREQLAVVADQYGAPTSAALIADVTALAVYRWLLAPETAPTGLFHLAAAGRTNWHAYASHVIGRAIAAGRPMRVPPEQIRAIATRDYPTPAQRPANSCLATGKLQAALNVTLPAWEQGVDHILKQILQAS